MRSLKISMRLLLILNLCLCIVILAACQEEQKDVDVTPGKPPATVNYSGVEVFKVRLENPVKRADINGNIRTWNEAHMVRLKISKIPASGPLERFFLGEEQISEYGGWKEGIYFWVYDPEKLKTFDGRAIGYRFAQGKHLNLGILELGDPHQFKTINEADLRERVKE